MPLSTALFLRCLTPLLLYVAPNVVSHVYGHGRVEALGIGKEYCTRLLLPSSRESKRWVYCLQGPKVTPLTYDLERGTEVVVRGEKETV